MANGRRQMNGLEAKEECICPKCGYKIQKNPCIPCYRLTCPKCRIKMAKTNK